MKVFATVLHDALDLEGKSADLGILEGIAFRNKKSAVKFMHAFVENTVSADAMKFDKTEGVYNCAKEGQLCMSVQEIECPDAAWVWAVEVRMEAVVPDLGCGALHGKAFAKESMAVALIESWAFAHRDSERVEMDCTGAVDIRGEGTLLGTVCLTIV